jgi:hypothetical protein
LNVGKVISFFYSRAPQLRCFALVLMFARASALFALHPLFKGSATLRYFALVLMFARASALFALHPLFRALQLHCLPLSLLKTFALFTGK